MNGEEGDGLGIEQDCNCIYAKYCDGASFAGYQSEPWPVPGGGNLTFRGLRNLDRTVEWALEHGMAGATEFVLTGGSAGGLSTFMHADRVAARVRAGAPNCTRIHAAPDVGFFLDHPPIEAVPPGAAFTDQMLYIFAMQNISFGPGGALSPACRERFPDTLGLCFMAPHFADLVETPLFVLNSKFDSFQLGSVLQDYPGLPHNWSTAADRDAVRQYAVDFLRQLAPVLKQPRNGAAITSCICHGCPWDSLFLEGRTLHEHYVAWLKGEASGAEAIHIDNSTWPNGDGAIALRCQAFPAPGLSSGR